MIAIRIEYKGSEMTKKSIEYCGCHSSGDDYRTSERDL